MAGIIQRDASAETVNNARRGVSPAANIIGFTAPLTIDGVFGGVSDATGDYSVTPTNFEILPLADPATTLIITTIVVYIEDTGKLSSATYGNGVTLTNGIEISFRNFGETSVTSERIFVNPDYLIIAPGTQQLLEYGNNAGALRTAIDFNDTVYPCLRGGKDDFVRFTLNDDFTGLDRHRFTAIGFIKGVR